jgi:hypothetical protein
VYQIDFSGGRMVLSRHEQEIESGSDSAIHHVTRDLANLAAFRGTLNRATEPDVCLPARHP